MDVTTGVGLVISADQPGRFTRLRRADAIKESSSFNPSKVRMAARMGHPFAAWPDYGLARALCNPPSGRPPFATLVAGPFLIGRGAFVTVRRPPLRRRSGRGSWA